MALRTPDTPEEQDAAHNKSQASYNEKFQHLAAREKSESVPGYSQSGEGAGDSQVDANEDPNQNISGVKDKEANAGGWKTDLTGRGVYGNKAFERGRPLSYNNVKAILKKKGPLGLIAVVLLGGGIGVASFLPALLPIHVLESLVNKYDTQNTSMTIRTNKVIASKLSNMATEGYCNTVKITCRFSRPSNYMLAQFEKNGIKALDKNGKVITKNGLFPNERPAQFEFTDGSGKKLNIKASEFSNTLRSNDTLRAAFHSAYNPRYIGYTDAVFKEIQSRFGFSKKNTLADAKDNEDAKSKINEEVKGTKTVSADTPEAAESAVKDALKQEGNKSAEKLAKAGKGNAVGLAAGTVCLIGDVPSVVVKTVRAYQLSLVIKYGMIFLSAQSAIKAGDAKASETTAMGDLMTSVVAGKSAMDSFGMRYTLFGDTKTTDSSYQKFIPGGSAMSSLKGITQITSSPAKRQACEVATSPLTGAAIDVATSETIVGPFINFFGGLLVSTAIEKLAPIVIDGVIAAIPPQTLQDIMKYLVGDLTQNLVGQDVGNALTSAASNMMSQTANAGANMPLTVEQAVAYENTSKQVQLAYAAEDRTTHSPLDATNQNTMVGSMVNQFLPYYGNINTFADVLGSTASIATSSLQTLLPSANAATVDKSQYTLCTDPTVTDSNTAAGPFCNVVYGIPPQYLDEDPQAIVDKLVANGNIDETTGEPKADSELQKWKDFCTDGSTDGLNGCKITDETTASYALYMIDHRIQKTMDDMDTAAESSSTTASGSTGATTPGAGAVSGTAIKGDDYPYGKGPIDIASPLGYMTRECVDFVAWRLNEQSGITSAPFKFSGYGNASTWKDTARINGYAVDKKPTLGSVAWWGPMVSAVLTAGPLGHVAIVSAINDDGSIIIEQYNGLFPGHTYSQYTLPASAVAKLEFLHIADIK